MSDYSQDELIKNSLISIYYSLVFFVLYIFMNDRIGCSTKVRVKKRKHRAFLTFCIILSSILTCYFIITLYPALHLDNRVEKIEYYFNVVRIPGLSFIKWQLTAIIIFLCLSYRRVYYVLLFMPFIIVDIFTSGRENLFHFLVLYILCCYSTFVKIRLRWLLPCILFLFFIALFRNANTQFNFLSFAFHSLGEFIFTWQTPMLVDGYFSNEQFYVSFMRYLIPNGLSSQIFQYDVYQESINDYLNYGFGLSSSIILEAKVNNDLMLYLHPLIISFVCFFVYSLTERSCGMYFKLVVRYFMIIWVYSIYRGGAYINLALYIYVLIIYLPYLWIYMRKNNEISS